MNSIVKELEKNSTSRDLADPGQGTAVASDLASERLKRALVEQVLKDSGVKQMSSGLQSEVSKLSELLLESYASHDPASLKLSAQQISTQLKMLHKNQPNSFEEIIKQLNRIATAKDGPADLVDYAGKIASDVLFELSDPERNIHQGVSYACAVTSREYIKNSPAIYAEFIADVLNEGHGYIAKKENGVRKGLMTYEEGTLTELKGRTAGCAIYEDILLKTFGAIEEGLMPADVERFMEARGKAAVLMTASTEVSNKPQYVDNIIEKIKQQANEGKSGIISLDFSSNGAHAKHCLEICSSVGVPEGYIKLSNPWELKNSLPERYQNMISKGMIKDNGDGTFLIHQDFLKDNLYFVVLSTDKDSDFGVTRDVKEGVYKSTQQPTYFGLNNLDDQSNSINKKSYKLAETIRQVSAGENSKKLEPAEVSKTKTGKESEPDTKGKEYFDRLATGALFKN